MKLEKELYLLRSDIDLSDLEKKELFNAIKSETNGNDYKHNRLAFFNVFIKNDYYTVLVGLQEGDVRICSRKTYFSNTKEEDVQTKSAIK